MGNGSKCGPRVCPQDRFGWLTPEAVNDKASGEVGEGQAFLVVVISVVNEPSMVLYITHIVPQSGMMMQGLVYT